jgi:hypothetical protein
MKVKRNRPKQTGTKYRPARRYVNQADQVNYAAQLDKTVNNPMNFSYLDYNRNINMIRSNQKIL